jgi:hypothetical protein
MTGTGHPLPGSDEARHNEIPEHLERDKGRGDDPAAAVQPAGDAVTPDGEPYPAEDLGRGPAAANQESEMQDDRSNDVQEDVSADTPRTQGQSGQSGGGRQVGGGPGPSDMAPPGGSSGTGGYGNAQNQQLHQGQQDRTLSGGDSDPDRSRGDRFDEQQGGGRGADAVSDADELQRDQAEHQDRGQSVAEAESDKE